MNANNGGIQSTSVTQCDLSRQYKTKDLRSVSFAKMTGYHDLSDFNDSDIVDALEMDIESSR